MSSAETISDDRPAPRRHDVMLVADMCVDIVLRGNVRPKFGQFEQIIGDYILDIGGSGNLFACQASKLGLDAAVLGHVGADAFGAFLTRRLAEEGVDVARVTVDPDLRTGLGVTLTEPDDRAILTYPGSIDAFAGSELPIRPAEVARHWHVASYYLLGPATAGLARVSRRSAGRGRDDLARSELGPGRAMGRRRGPAAASRHLLSQ